MFYSRNRLVVRTPRCGRGNPGSNPGYGTRSIILYIFQGWILQNTKSLSTRMGFEPTRAEHIGLAVQRLNHSATSSSGQIMRFALGPASFRRESSIWENFKICEKLSRVRSGIWTHAFFRRPECLGPYFQGKSCRAWVWRLRPLGHPDILLMRIPFTRKFAVKTKRISKNVSARDRTGDLSRVRRTW
jgi:hypothetical protein